MPEHWVLNAKMLGMPAHSASSAVPVSACAHGRTANVSGHDSEVERTRVVVMISCCGANSEDPS